MRAIVQRAPAEPRGQSGTGLSPRTATSRSTVTISGRKSPRTPRLRLLQSPAVEHSLRQPRASVSVPAMPQPPGPARRARRAQHRSAHRLRRFAGLTAVAAVGVVTLLVTAFGPDGAQTAARSAPAPANRLLPSGPPEPLVVATQGALRVSSRSSRTASPRSATTRGSAGALALAAARPPRQPGSARRASSIAIFGSGDGEHRLVPARRRDGVVDRGARRRRRARTPTSTRPSTGRSRDHRLRAQRPDARHAHRHPARSPRPSLVVSITRLARRPGADGRLVRRRGGRTDRRGARPLARSSARRSRATRRTPGTT